MRFLKMHSCGNNFCIVEDEECDFSKLSKKICNPKIGVGADGLIIIKRKPLEMKCYDNNGEIVNLSANGIRCFAKYVIDNKIVESKCFDVITRNGKININIENVCPFLCKISIGKPNFNNSMIYVKDNISSFGRTIKINDYRISIYSLYIGDIETIIFVDSLDSSLIDISEEISNYSLFSRKTNVNFVHILDDKNIEIKSYIKNVGFTESSGTGACASVIAAAKLGLTKNKVNVKLEYGNILVEYGKKEIVTLSGDAHVIISGDYKEDLLC